MPNEQKSVDVVGLIKSPLVAAILTAATSLIIFTFNQVKQIDARLDELEKEARLLLTPEGAGVLWARGRRRGGWQVGKFGDSSKMVGHTPRIFPQINRRKRRWSGRAVKKMGDGLSF